MSSNNRKHSRVPKRIKSEVSSKDGLTFSTTQNLSGGGMFITTPDPITPGTELELSLKMPDGDMVSVKGIVRWIRDESKDGDLAGMGIEFLDIKDSDSTRIKNMLN